MKKHQLAEHLRVGDKIFWQASGFGSPVIPLTVVSIGEDCVVCKHDILDNTLMYSHAVLDDHHWTYQPSSPKHFIMPADPPAVTGALKAPTIWQRLFGM
jgi:hypothetical protein